MEFHLRAQLSSNSKSMEFHLRAPLLTTTDSGIWLRRIPDDGISSSCTAFLNLASSNSKSMEFHLRAPLLTTTDLGIWLHRIPNPWNFIFVHSYQLIRESGFIEFQMMEFHLRAPLSTDFGIWLHRIPDDGISSSCTAIN